MGTIFSELVSVMESHLGRFSRPLVTTLIIVVFLAVFSLCTKIIWDYLVSPIVNFFLVLAKSNVVDWEIILKQAVIPFVVYIALIGIAIFAVYIFNKRKSK